MGWVNYPDFRMGVLDRGTRLAPEIALRSAASASDVLIDTRGGVVRRPGFEDQGVQLDNEFVTIPYFTEEETYLFVITYGDNVLEWNDAVTGSDSGAADRETPDTGDQTWTVGTGTPITGHTQFTGKIYLYKVSQADSETGAIDVGFVTQQYWATTSSDYLFGPQHTIRRGQLPTITAGNKQPDLSHYLHPWTKAQCQGMQYAQHGSRIYLFPSGFPTIEIQNSDGVHHSITPTHTSATAPHASAYPEAQTEYALGISTTSDGAWNFEVDALEPEVVRRASPPINLLLTSTTTLVASDDFFTKDMISGLISYGSTQHNAVESATWGHDLCSGVMVRIVEILNSRKATVAIMNASSSTPLVENTYTTGHDIYNGKNLRGQTLTPGDISTLTSTMMGDWCGPWTREYNDAGLYFHQIAAAATGFVHSESPDKAVAPVTEGMTEDTGADPSTSAMYYHCDSTSNVGLVLKNQLEWTEQNVGSILQVWDNGSGASPHVGQYAWWYYLTGVTDTDGGHDFSGTLRYHFQEICIHAQGGGYAQFSSSVGSESSHEVRTFDNTSYFYPYSVKPPFIQVGVSGTGNYGSVGPRDLSAQTYKQSIHVNDPQFLPANLHTPNRPIKSGGVARASVGTVAPLMGGASIFFRNGIFRPTARVSAVCYEGYWERRPTTGAPQNFMSIGSGGSTGFATCGTQHQGRLVVGGFGGAFEDAVVFSKTAQPRHMMSPHIDSAEDAFSIQLGQSTEEQVNWFGSTQVGLVVGGKTGEYLIRGEPVSAMKIAFQRVSSVGGANIRACYTDAEIVFVCSDKRALGGVQIQEGADQTTFSSRLSDRASTLFTNDIIQSGYVYSPHPTFFHLMDNGTMLTFTRDQSVGGFTTMSHAHGTIKSLSSAVRSSKISDTLFACVQRTIGGAIKNRLERLNFTALLDSQRCTTQYTVDYSSDLGVITRNAITTDKVRFLNPWASTTVSVITVDASGNKVYRGELPVRAEITISDSVCPTDSGSADREVPDTGDQTWGASTDFFAGQIITDYYIDLSSLGLTEAPTKVITGFNFDGVFEPSSVTEMPGYICSYTSVIMLGESVTGLTINKGDIVPVKSDGTAHLSESGWLNVYNLGHFSRDAGPEFTLKGPFSSTVQSLSIEVESKE